MDQDKEKIKRLEESQAQLIKDLLNEAIEHKSDSVKLLEQVAKDRNIDLSTKSKTKKKVTPKMQVEYFEEEEDDSEHNYNDDSDYYDEEEDDNLDYLIDDSDIPFDLVPLPSKGLVYKGIKGKLPVAYLTASDEDLITSPNLYLDDKIIDILLRKKILDKSLRPENLCKGDRDAIIVWLRATGYGSDFPVSVTDPLTGKNFSSNVDLSGLKIKDFNLKPDIDGFFDYKLPKTGDLVKFKFMSHKDELSYIKLLEKTNPNFKKIAIRTSINSIKDIFQNDNSIDSKLKTDLTKSIELFEEYFRIVSESNSNNNIALKNVTYLLERSIMSINGNSDKTYIKKYINQMPAMDSSSIRRYISENTPGVDFKIMVERPESLGGGSFETFLELDSTIFLNISRI